jgi:hypothetical protein
VDMTTATGQLKPRPLRSRIGLSSMAGLARRRWLFVLLTDRIQANPTYDRPLRWLTAVVIDRESRSTLIAFLLVWRGGVVSQEGTADPHLPGAGAPPEVCVVT